MKYTVKIQERPGAMIRPICVEAETPVAAITAACDDYLHPIGTAMPTEVFPGHDGWYAYGEAVWRGEIDWHPGYAAQCCTRELAATGLRVGDRIECGEGDDRDTGTVGEIDGDKITIQWDSLVTTTQPIDGLRPYRLL